MIVIWIINVLLLSGIKFYGHHLVGTAPIICNAGEPKPLPVTFFRYICIGGYEKSKALPSSPVYCQQLPPDIENTCFGPDPFRRDGHRSGQVEAGRLHEEEKMKK
ncbi:hypothetical protein I3843_12G032700 [Carya illinoinensis]|nr:hypothetical protein I3843_12G032700 [Carya illinoinensis]